MALTISIRLRKAGIAREGIRRISLVEDENGFIFDEKRRRKKMSETW
jgi:hypothetical protein